jgi:hypothetical protein
MRAGDLVRFRECTFHGEPKEYTEWRLGLLLEYKKWYKIAKINYNGNVYNIHASDVQLHQQAKR